MNTAGIIINRLNGPKLSGGLLSGIVSLGCIIRIAVCYFSSLPHIHRDSVDYLQQADTILAGGYTNYFPNGYPFIIALFKIFSGESLTYWLLALNITLSSLVIYFIYDITKRVFKNNLIGILAALIIAFFPTQINYVRWLTSEVPATFFLIGGYFFYLRKNGLISGLFFGMAIIIRTEFLPIVLIIFCLEGLLKKSWNFRLIAGAIIPMVLVSSYCYLKTGQFSMAGHGKVNIMYSITASSSYVDWYFVDKHPEIKTTGQAVQMYLDTAISNPVRYLQVRVINLWEMWGFYSSSSDGNRSSLFRLVIGITNFFLIVFGIGGWWKNRKDLNISILLIPFIVITGVHIFLLALPRYTFSVEPFLIITASYFLFNLISNPKKAVQNTGN